MWNQFKTIFFLGLLTALLLIVGQLIAGQQGLFVGLILAIIMNFGSYFLSDKIVLAIYKAKPASKSDYPELYKIVKEVSDKAKIPMPKIYILPMNISNAFATGRNPKHAVVAVTERILKLLNKEELKGVIAHEISHIKNRDILIQTIAATIAGVISYVAMFARFGAISGDRDDRGNNILSLLVIGIITPIIAMLIQLAISRSREYLADESGARLIRDSRPLANALEKLEADVKRNPLNAMPVTEATAHMFITSPFSKKGIVSLFMTHPSTEERVKRLKSLKFGK